MAVFTGSCALYDALDRIRCLHYWYWKTARWFYRCTNTYVNLRTGNRFIVVLYIGTGYPGRLPVWPCRVKRTCLRDCARQTMRERVCLHISCSFRSDRPLHAVKPRSRNRTDQSDIMGILLPGAFCLLYIKQVPAPVFAGGGDEGCGGTSRWLVNAGRAPHGASNPVFEVWFTHGADRVAFTRLWGRSGKTALTDPGSWSVCA